MKEKNHDVLANALNKLPVYSAPEDSWEQIELSLHDSDEDGLGAKLKQLPVYSAPDHVWTKIQGELRGRRRPFYRTTWGMAAIFILLISLAGLWNMLSPADAPKIAPMTEKKVPLSEMSDVQMADFEDKMQKEEAELQACIEARKAKYPDSLQSDMQADIEQLSELTQTRDSLSFFLTHGKGRPGTSPRMDRLEEKRNLLIKKLREQLCSEKE